MSRKKKSYARRTSAKVMTRTIQLGAAAATATPPSPQALNATALGLLTH